MLQKEDIGKSMKNALMTDYTCYGMPKGTSWAESMLSSEKIKPIYSLARGLGFMPE